MKDFAMYLINNLVEKKDKVNIDQENKGDIIYITVSIDSSDRGKLIGKNGAIINSIRTILNSKSRRDNKKVVLKLKD